MANAPDGNLWTYFLTFLVSSAAMVGTVWKAVSQGKRIDKVEKQSQQVLTINERIKGLEKLTEEKFNFVHARLDIIVESQKDMKDSIKDMLHYMKSNGRC